MFDIGGAEDGWLGGGADLANEDSVCSVNHESKMGSWVMPVRLDEQLTPRISLRSAQPEDAVGLFALIEVDRDYLNEWIPWVGAIRSADEMESIIEDRDKGKDGKGPAFCMLYEGKVAGWVSFLSVAEQPNVIELECWVGAAYQGKWVAAICGRRLIAYAFEVLDRDRVVACSAVGNMPSARLLQRLGFTQEQLLKNADTIHGRVIDLMLYSLARR